MVENTRCVTCKRGSLLLADSARAVCNNQHCGSSFPVVHGVLDMLVAPDAEVVRELQGMALESKISADDWRAYKVTLHEERLATLEERASMATDVGQYDRQTILNFEQALALLGDLEGKRVLEVGADHDYHFLQRFRALGAACVAANIHFRVERSGKYVEWPEKVLADMNNLPFQDGSFDVVLLSATSHHSSDLEKTVAEVARVLAPNGRALFLSDPIGGIFKRLGGPTNVHGRDSLIHENEFPIWRYHAAFRRNGLQPKYLFSAFYDAKLKAGQIHPEARFATFSRYLSRAWEVGYLRKLAKKNLTWPAHFLFGFPMNVVLTKTTSRSAGQ